MTKFENLGDKLYWSYACLAMFFSAMKNADGKYKRVNFMVRSKLYKGLKTDTMNIKSMFIDERMKLLSEKCCNYCGSEDNLQLDHILPKNRGGKDCGENLILACRRCNASKSDTCLMEWYTVNRNEFPDPWITRNYLKLVIEYCKANNLMEIPIEDIATMKLPFNCDYIPVKYPEPADIFEDFQT